MRWLLWKDYRANRMILGMAIFLLVVPHLMLLLGLWSSQGRDPGIPNVASGLIVSAVWSLGLLQLALAFFGGNIIAGERMERTAEFLAYLPVSRRQILASKLLVALGLLAVMWLPNLLILGLAAWGRSLQGTFAADALAALLVLPFIGSAVFGVAWLSSALSRNPVLAVCLGVLAPVAVGLVFWALAYFLHDHFFDFLPVSYAPWVERHGAILAMACYDGLCLLVAIVGFVVGTWQYLRRVEP